eukprot:g19497.t1
MPLSQKARERIAAQGRENMSCFDNLSATVGRKRANEICRDVVGAHGALPVGFLEKSVELPDVVKKRLQHVREPMPDEKERGVVWLSPDDYMDIAVKLRGWQMHTQVNSEGKGEGLVVVHAGYEETVRDDIPLEYFRKEVESFRAEETVARRERDGTAGSSRVSKKMKCALEIASSGAALQEAVGNLDAMVDMAANDKKKATLVSRYEQIAQELPHGRGTFDSVRAFLAVQVAAGYKTTQSAINEVLKAVNLSEEEEESIRAQVATLKRRGHIERSEQRTPITLAHIIAAWEAKKLSQAERRVLLLGFYACLRAGELPKMGRDYRGVGNDGPIKTRWEGGDLILDFTKTRTKVNSYSCIRVRCCCRQLVERGASTLWCVCSLKGHRLSGAGPKTPRSAMSKRAASGD